MHQAKRAFKVARHSFGARDYEPVSGRWTGKDSARFSRGAVNVFSYVQGDPINLVDLNGRYLSHVHYAVTYIALRDAGYDPITSTLVAAGTVLADAGTQGKADAYKHSMTPAGSTPEKAREERDKYVDAQLATGTIEGLSNAIHAMQDESAEGHGFKEYDGSVGMEHLKSDAFPTEAQVFAAYEATRALASRFKPRRPAPCP